MRRLRFLFWSWVHDYLEKTWHWVYYHRVIPNRPDPAHSLPGAMYWNHEGIWRQNADGTYTKLSSGIDVG